MPWLDPITSCHPLAFSYPCSHASYRLVCLGFYEQSASKILGIPRSLCGHSKALHAWEFLLEPAPPEGYCSCVNADYTSNGPSSSKSSSSSREQGPVGPTVWIPNHNNHSNPKNSKLNNRNDSNNSYSNNNSSSSSSKVGPSHTYRPKPRKSQSLHQHHHRYSTASSARMAWGSAQVPATPLLSQHIH